MENPSTPEEWTDKITAAADEELENFTVNYHSQKALREIFEEVHHLAGFAAMNELGKGVLELIEDNQYVRHPKASRVREMARYVVTEEFDTELPPTSSLLKSRNG